MQSVPETRRRGVRVLLLLAVALPILGCYNPPVDVSQTPAPFRFRLKKGEELSGRWEDEVTGGQLFSMYCGYCHNARAIGERPFSNYQNVVAHMRVRALMTGEEQAKIEAFFRRMHDVPPASAPIEAIAQAADLLPADSRAPRGVSGGRQGGREGQGRGSGPAARRGSRSLRPAARPRACPQPCPEIPISRNETRDFLLDDHRAGSPSSFVSGSDAHCRAAGPGRVWSCFSRSSNCCLSDFILLSNSASDGAAACCPAAVSASTRSRGPKLRT